MASYAASVRARCYPLERSATICALRRFECRPTKDRDICRFNAMARCKTPRDYEIEEAREKTFCFFFDTASRRCSGACRSTAVTPSARPEDVHVMPGTTAHQQHGLTPGVIEMPTYTCRRMVARATHRAYSRNHIAIRVQRALSGSDGGCQMPECGHASTRAKDRC